MSELKGKIVYVGFEDDIIDVRAALEGPSGGKFLVEMDRDFVVSCEVGDRFDVHAPLMYHDTSSVFGENVFGIRVVKPRGYRLTYEDRRTLLAALPPYVREARNRAKLMLAGTLYAATPAGIEAAMKGGYDPPESAHWPCGLTFAELAVACRNVGVDLSCGSCAGVFWTGIGGGGHTCDLASDPNTATGQVIFSTTPLTPEQRKAARSVNFAQHYGGSAEGLRKWVEGSAEVGVLRSFETKWPDAVDFAATTWLDLTKLDNPNPPECGARDCGAPGPFIDPAGVGWCRDHVDCGLYEAPARFTVLGGA